MTKSRQDQKHGGAARHVRVCVLVLLAAVSLAATVACDSGPSFPKPVPTKDSIPGGDGS